MFELSYADQCSIRLEDLLPEVVDALHKNKSLDDFVFFFELLSKGDYPLSCIAFSCWLDTVRWYSLPNTTQMVYREETKLFWRVVYKLFHGAAIRFFSGVRSLGQVVTNEGNRGHLSAGDSHINFAVPDIGNLATFDATSLPNVLSPGVIQSALDIKSSSPHSMVLSVDAKKVALGLSSEWGDIDLMGYEQPGLAAMKEGMQADITVVEELQESLEQLPGLTATVELIPRISSVLQIVTGRIKELRELIVTQTLRMKKLIKQAGEKWKESNMVGAISRVKANIFQLKKCASELLNVNGHLLRLGAKLQGTDTTPASVSIETLKHLKSLPHVEMHDVIDPRLVKQRSELWFSLRKCYPLTGSTMYKGLGFGGLSNLKDHIKVHVKQEQESTPTPEVQERLDHGTKNEINALATLAGMVIPHFFPALSILEEGCRIVTHDSDNLLLVSPDGGLYDTGDVESFIDSVQHGLENIHWPTPMIAVEIKCPFPGDFKTPVQYKLPIYYVTQVLAEMAAMGVSFCLFCSWSVESMVVHLVEFDEELWEELVQLGAQLYCTGSTSLPTRIPIAAKQLQLKLKKFTETHVSLWCEVPSVHLGCVPHTREENLAEPMTTARMARDALRKSHHLLRRKASEVMVWLLSDVHRMWHAEIPHSIPVCYVMKGYSLPLSIMRDMNSDVLDACKEKGIHVACTTFDGSFLAAGYQRS